MAKLNGCIFLLKMMKFEKKSIWNKVSNSIKKNFIVNPSTIKNFWNQNKIFQ